MNMSGRVATWLELAVAPEWHRQAVHVRVHQVGAGKDECYTLSMDGRCVCTSNGQLTTFRGRPAVERFLEMVRVHDAEVGEPDPDLRAFPRGHYCLSLDRQNTLCPCEECRDDGMQVCMPRCSTARANWLPPMPEWRSDACRIPSRAE